jgi:5'-nucleotidase
MRILLSNDDGNFAIGSKLLINLLKPNHELVVAGPTKQMSSISSSVTIKGFTWTKEQKDGVTYYNADGTPNDAIELLYTQNEKPFDLVVSGINWGPNLGTYLYRSGTYSAVTCALGFDMAPHGIAFSYDIPEEFWKKENTSEVTESLLDYPGKALLLTFNKIVENNYFGAKILNVNFPSIKTTKMKLTKLTPKQQDTFDISWKPTDNNFSYVGGRNLSVKLDDSYDNAALSKGIISITPCIHDLTDFAAIETQGNLL